MKGVLSSAFLLAAVALAGCTVHQTEAPGFSGPSGLALTIRVSALPDSISQDGGSQSSIQITAIGPDGQPKNAVPVRVDMFVNGVGQDYGTLSARSLVTNSSGVANVIYTAPPAPTAGIFGTCKGLPGNCVEIVATPSGLGFETASPERVTIRLVPTGVILPPAGAPTAAFTFSPQPATTDALLLFDASTSQVGAGASQIVSYNWTFGDGTTGTGKNPTHSYATPNTYNVTLTVTNDRTLSATTSQLVNVAAAATPIADFVFSPAAPSVDQAVTFDASTSTPAAGPGGGQPIVSYLWTFGDNTAPQTTSSPTFSHTYGIAGLYSVTLVVRDSAGRVSPSKAKTVPVGAPVACVPGTSPLTPCVTLNVSPSSTYANTPITIGAVVTSYGTGATSITSYQWDFGDGTPQINSGAVETVSHTYTRTGTFTVKVTATNNAGRLGSATITVLVQ
jgi:PKD repeat protein